MEQNPKKSKALLITIIAIVILGVVVYLLFKNSDKVFNVKGKATTDKNFTPLLNSTREGDATSLNTVEGGAGASGTQSSLQTSSSQNQGGVATTSGGATSGTGSSGNTYVPQTSSPSQIPNLISNIIPSFNPLPTPNDNTPLPPVYNPNPTPTPTGGGGAIPPVVAPNPNSCPDNDPLVFTDAEKEELGALLRQYYLIAPTLKNEDDVAMVASDLANNQALVDQANELNRQCLLEKSNSGYSGPQAIKDNPYYNDPNNNNSTPYVQLYSQLEDLFHIW